MDKIDETHYIKSQAKKILVKRWAKTPEEVKDAKFGNVRLGMCPSYLAALYVTSEKRGITPFASRFADGDLYRIYAQIQGWNRVLELKPEIRQQILFDLYRYYVVLGL